MGISDANLVQTSRTKLPGGVGKEGRGPLGAVASAASTCVSGGTVGRCGIGRIGSGSTDGDNWGVPRR